MKILKYYEIMHGNLEGKKRFELKMAMCINQIRTQARQVHKVALKNKSQNNIALESNSRGQGYQALHNKLIQKRARTESNPLAGGAKRARPRLEPARPRS